MIDDLLSALEGVRTIDPITNRRPEFDSEAAYDVSAGILARRRERGETPIGRKIGFTNRGIWEEYNVSAPMWGHVYDTTVTFLDRPSGRLAIGHLAQPRIEPEVVLHFARAPDLSGDEADILSSLDWIAHGFEIVQCHFPDWKFRLPDAIADFGLHGALIVGPKQPIAGLGAVADVVRTFAVALRRNGRLEASGIGANALGSPIAAAGHLIHVLRSQPRFAPVRAGEIVTTGTLTPALPIRSGDVWTTELTGIGLPGLTVHFD